MGSKGEDRAIEPDRVLLVDIQLEVHDARSCCGDSELPVYSVVSILMIPCGIKGVQSITGMRE